MRFVTAVFSILLNLAAATFHFSCVCNSITPGTDWVYNWELTKYACLHNYAGGADYDSGSGRCIPNGDNTLDGDQWLADCRRDGTVDGYYRYKKDDTLDLSVTLWVWKASSTCGD
ncbi:hypothetical protein E4U57_006043 [Claviceps arundinis]|uniref:Cyanovirin-N domain-containing protein n=1 Tax=Claviceps arundinis TaxID=1623583 RepID=A0A9P7SNM5_9HYPO|nr:hypothetical protein E4U56_003756 [Claviceps arundinis]KAG5968493.1 hypothetical protein E4U57_006043 [Claviceps arundinis]